MQKDVGQERRDDSTLRRALRRLGPLSFLHDACVQPLADRSDQHSITYPSVQDLPHPLLLEGAETVVDICLRMNRLIRV